MSRPRDYTRERDRRGVTYYARYAADCAACGKKCYPARDLAKAVARVLYPGRKMRAYKCGGEFHVTSQDAETAELERRQAAAS